MGRFFFCSVYIYEINVKLDITTKLFYFWLTGFMLNTHTHIYIFNLIYHFQASVSIRSRYFLYIDDCVSTTKNNYMEGSGSATIK